MKVLNLAEAAEFLRLSPYTLRELVSAGKVPGAKVGGEWRFTDESLEAYMRKLVVGENKSIAPPEILAAEPKRPARRQQRQPPRLLASESECRF